MLYQFYEWNHAALTPLRAVADATRLFYQNPLNPFSHTQAGRTVAAMAELFERTTRVYGKPEFGLYETLVDGQRIPVQDRVVWQKPFAQLLHFERELPRKHGADPRFLVVAPMSGHYATLLRGTVDALLPYADVYITDWQDARRVSLTEGKFDLDDYVDYLIEMLEFLGPDTHVIGVCQPAVPVMMAVARMEAEDNAASPATMTLMGGPIDTRINPTAVNRLAEEKGIDWFRENVIMKVPFPQAGFMRDVYPGFLQLTGFMSMNLDRHMSAHKEFFWHLVKDDGDGADKHREFYDEYNAVMDLTAEFYLQTVESVFITHALPKGEMMHREMRIDLTKIRKTALLTIEGENDDISGVGQTEAAQTLCSSIPDDRRVHYVQPKVGHYGVFNGSRFRAEIAPRIVDFALTHGTTHSGASLPRKAAKPGGGLQREGAVEARAAKAAELGRHASAGGETGLSGVLAPAAALKAAMAPAEALMRSLVAPAETPAVAAKAAPEAREERTAVPAAKALKSAEPEKAVAAVGEGKHAPAAEAKSATTSASASPAGTSGSEEKTAPEAGKTAAAGKDAETSAPAAAEAKSSAATSVPGEATSKAPEPEPEKKAVAEAAKPSPAAAEAGATPPVGKAEGKAAAATSGKAAPAAAGTPTVVVATSGAASAAAESSAAKASEADGAPAAEAAKPAAAAAAAQAKPAQKVVDKPWRRNGKASKASARRGRRNNR